MFQRRTQVRIVGVVILALDGEGRNAVVTIQGRGHFILGGERVGSAQHCIGAAVAQGDHQVRGFAGHVQTSRNAQALKRLLLDEALADGFEHGHLLPGPFDLAFAGVSQPDILHITFFQFSDCQGLAPQFWISIVNGVNRRTPLAARGKTGP